MLELTKIRSWNGSQNEAFEELVCQLARYEQPDADAEFTRIRGSGGDAGVECYWTAADNRELGWQAKYFFSLRDSQWRQIDESVMTAITKHPKLARYVVALPTNLTDTQKRHWDDRVIRWKEWADSAGIDVAFEFWGEFEILDRLSREEHIGRRRFWFGKDEMSFPWMSKRMDEVIKTVGPRYTPEANVEVEIAQSLHAVARTSAFYERIRSLCKEAKIAFRDLGKPKLSDPAIMAALDGVCTQFESLDALLDNLCSNPSFAPIDFPLVVEQASQLRACRSVIAKLIYGLHHSGDAKVSRTELHIDAKALDSLESKLTRLIWPIDKIIGFCQSNDARAANTGALLVNGEPGTGKTHLFCDVARSRIAQQLPTVMLLGEWFTGDEPWSQILRRLHLSCSDADEFLGTLQALAEASGDRCLILIDALNETRNRDSWQHNLPSMLEAIARYPGVALAVSCRSTYEKHVLPDNLIREKLPCVEHHGFVDNETAAIAAYCRCYQIEEPNVPILRPEFANPLFLRLFCQSLQDMGETRVSKGLRGITAICNSFVNNINRKLSHPKRLDYDEKRNPVATTLGEIAARMAKNRSYWIRREEAQAIADAALPGRSDYSKSLYANLVHEGVVVEFQPYEYDHSTKSGSNVDAVKLGFERFTDHIIIRSILSNYDDRTSLEAAFASDEALIGLYGESSWAYQGWTEALSIQIPEKYDCELVDIIPGARNWTNIQEAFLKSLIWRDPKCIYESTDDYLNTVFNCEPNKVLDTLLMLTADSEHPYNALMLHDYLKPMSMPERDQIWSTFLFDSNSEDDSTARRLINWAWHSDTNAVGEDSVELCGIALAWFFTTSHRFVRDRATKALVSLLKNRPVILKNILSKFAGVDDLYVQERLYAVAYGVSTITIDSVGLSQLAAYVYETVFKDGKPIPHILLRDYARGVIEVANRRRLLPESIDLDLVRPPYSSSWPLDIPSEESLKKYGEWNKDSSGEDHSQVEIYHSVMGVGDFARYVIGSRSHWFKQEIGEPFGQNQAAVDHFVQSLSRRQKREWNRLEKTSHNISLTSIDQWVKSLDEKAKDTWGEAGESEDRQTDEVFPFVTAIKNALSDEVEECFLATLREPQRIFYDEYVAPFIDNYEVGKYDMRQVERWVLKRVFDLGWTVERFGRIDRYRGSDYRRSAHKPERIGKKYQWIALHECLAYLADHLMMESGISDQYPVLYSTPCQLSVRDIDPTYIAYDPDREESNEACDTWWHPMIYQYSSAGLAEMNEWALRTDDVPAVGTLMILTDSDGSEWLPLYANYSWPEPHDYDLDHDKPHRDMWFHVRSYLVRKEHSDKVFESLRKRNQSGRLFLNTGEFGDVFLGEYGWADACNIPELQQEWTTDDGRLPHPVMDAAIHYYGVSEYDCSLREHTGSGFLPSLFLLDTTKLEWSRTGFGFVDSSGQLVIQDPSVNHNSKASLLIKKGTAQGFIYNGMYDILWVVIGGRWVIGRGRNTSKERPLSGAYRLVDGHLRGSLSEFTQSYEAAGHKVTTRKGRTLHEL